MQLSVRVDNTRIAPLRGAFSAVLRRSQDFNIGNQKHQHVDRFRSPRILLCIQQPKLLRSEKHFPARCCSTVSTIRRKYVMRIFQNLTITLGGRGCFYRDY